MEEVSWVETTMDLVAQELERAELEGGDKFKERVNAWRLRLVGYSMIDIAEELGISVGTAHADVHWAQEHLASAYESAEAFRRVSLPQLDQQYRELLAMRTETAHRVAMGVKDLQAKLLGAYAPTRIDANIKTQYEIVDVNTKEL